MICGHAFFSLKPWLKFLKLLVELWNNHPLRKIGEDFGNFIMARSLSHMLAGFDVSLEFFESMDNLVGNSWHAHI